MNLQSLRVQLSHRTSCCSCGRRGSGHPSAVLRSCGPCQGHVLVWRLVVGCWTRPISNLIREWKWCIWWITLPKTNCFPPKKMMLSNRSLRNLLFQGVSPFSGAMLVSGRVVQNIHAKRANLKKCWISLVTKHLSRDTSTIWSAYTTNLPWYTSKTKIKSDSHEFHPQESKSVQKRVVLGTTINKIFHQSSDAKSGTGITGFSSRSLNRKQLVTDGLVKRKPPKLQNSWSSLANSSYHMLYFMDCWPTFTVNKNAKRRSMLHTCYHLNIIVNKVQQNGRSISPIRSKK